MRGYCVFSSDPTTCKFNGFCSASEVLLDGSAQSSSMQTIDSTIDSGGNVTYAEELDGGRSGTCSLQFSADGRSFTGTCPLAGAVACNFGGVRGAEGDGGGGGVILDASTD